MAIDATPLDSDLDDLGDAPTRLRSVDAPEESTFATAVSAIRIGQQLGPFRLVDLVGEGGMARIYRAEGPDGLVALKVTPLPVGADDSNRQRFEREGAILAELDHPNVVRLLGRGEEPALRAAWIAFELLPGLDLDTLLTRVPERRLSPPETLFVLERCARALSATHAAGVLHRDLKASNVVVTSAGEVKLIDFGIALVEDASVRLTGAGRMVGTLPYVAPEVIKQGWSPAADLYALGCLGYRLLSRRLPYRFDTVLAFVETHTARRPPRPLQDLAPHVPVNVVAIVESLMAPNPSDRPTAKELVARLQSEALAVQTERIAAAWRQGQLGAAFAIPDESVWTSVMGATPLTDGKRDQAGAEVARGRTVGPYLVERVLGRGAMGEIYLVRHEGLGQRYALKLLAAEWAEDEGSLARFEREMEALASVDAHPGIVRIHSAGRTAAGRPYFVMDYVEGVTLRQAIHGGLAHSPGLDLIEQVAEALEFAHARHLVHRDVKPDNILLTTEGRARLTDFGLSKAVFATGRRLTLTGDVVGTPTYMAPEQVSPGKGEVGPWSDVFALGALAYELFLGAPPFAAQTSVEVYSKLLDATSPPRFRSDDPSLDATVGRVVERALDPRPARRFASAGAFLSALRAARVELAEGTGRRRVPVWLMLTAAASVLLGSTTVGIAALRSDPPPDVASTPTATPTPTPVDPRAPASPATRARQAARAGETAPWLAALRELRPAKSAALRWELWPWTGGERPSLSADGETDWDLVASGEQALALGALGLAAIAFERALDDRSSEASSRQAAALGWARVALAQGRTEAAHRLWRRAWDQVQTSTGLGRARCLEVAAVLKQAGQQLPPAALSALDATEKTALTLLARARIEASAGRTQEARQLLQRLGVTLGDSFCAAERAALRQGADTAALAHALTLAAACVTGGHLSSVNQASLALDRAALLAPRSPSLWLARAGLERAQGRAKQAIAAARQALELSPGDPLAHAALADAERVARVEERTQADVAIAKGTPDPALERKLAADCRRELQARRAALERAKGPRANAARLALARTLLMRANHLARAGDDAAKATAEREQVASVLKPLLDLPRVAGVISARTALAAALSSEDPETLENTERELAVALAPLSFPHRRAAFQVLAQSETAKSVRAARVALGWGDLEGRALWALRRAERVAGHADRKRLLRHGRQLCPGSPDLTFAIACLAFEVDSLEVFGQGAAGLRLLAQVVAGSPERTGIVLAGLWSRALNDIEAEKAWGALRADEHVARALAAARGAAAQWRWRAALSAARASGSTPAQAGPHLLRVALLARVGNDERSRRTLARERAFAASCALGVAPGSALALQASLLVKRSVSSALLDRALAAGFLTNHATLDQDLVGRPAGDRVRRTLRPVARHLAKLDLKQVAHTLGFALLLERESLYPHLTLGLRVSSAEWSHQAWAKTLEGTLERLGTEAPTLALQAEALLKYDQSAREYAPKASKALRPSGLLAATQACARGRSTPRPSPRRYRPLRAPVALQSLLDLRPAQVSLERTWFRVEEDARFIRNSLYIKVRKPAAQDPLSRGGLSEWGLGGPAIEAVLAWDVQRKLAGELVWRDPQEGILAYERSVAAAEVPARRGSLAHTFAFWYWRWYGLERKNPLKRRVQVLQQGALLAARARAVALSNQHGSLREAEADLSLDLAGLAAPGSDARRQWTARAARLLREVRPEQIDTGLDYALPFRTWRRARLAAAQGNAAALEAAAGQAQKELKQFNAKRMRTDFKHYFKHDPLDPLLRAVPSARRFIERVLVEKPPKKP